MHLFLKQADYNMESAYSSFGVCLWLVWGIFVCLFVLKEKGISAFM